jgi:hypothetical protein
MTNQLTASANGATAKIKIKRPKFSTVWSNYPGKMDAPTTYKTIGGPVYELYKENPTGYANACALRLSRAFNYSGTPIEKTAIGYKVKGADNKIYLLRVTDMIKFVEQNYGQPDKTIIPKNGADVSNEFLEKKGILIFKVTGWQGATGHVTLWNGIDCGDHCYFIHPTQPNVRTTEVKFWELK